MVKNCKNCSALNNSACKKCSTCGVVFDKHGRPADTKASDGYAVSSGRPTNTKASDGYAVSSGRPTNTKASDGYTVSSGRPTNTKASDGYLVGTSGGRQPIPKPQMATWWAQVGVGQPIRKPLMVTLLAVGGE